MTSSTTTASANAVETNGSQCSQGNLSYTHYLFDAEADIPRLLGAGPSGLFTDAVSMNIFSEDSAAVVRRGIAPQTNFTGVDLAQGGLFSGFRAGFFAADLAVLVPRDSSWVAGFNVSNTENTISLNLLNHSAELTNFSGGFAAKAWAFLVPAYFGRIPRLRADDLTFSGSVDLTETSPDLHVFSSGFFVDGYGFLVPHSSRDGSPLGKVVRFHVDTLEVELLDLASLNENLAGFHSGIERDGFGYLVPGVFGWAARFELADFSTSSVQMLNLTYVGDFMGAHLDTFGSTVYFITLQGEFVAVDLPDFSLSDVSDGQLETEYSEYYPSLLYYPSAIAGWGRHSFLWSLGPTMLSLECDNGVAETGTPKTIVTFVMYGYDDASWREYAWALSMIDGRSPVSMHVSPGPFGSWVGENFLIERESGDVVLNVTWQEDMVSQEFQGIAGETLYLTVTPGNSSGGDGRWWDIIDDHGIAYSSWHQLYPTKQPFMAVGATLRAGGGHSERAKFEEFYVEPTATLSLSVSPRGDTNGTNIAWVLYDVNMDAIMRSGDEIWEKFPRNAIFSPRPFVEETGPGTTSSSQTATVTLSSTSSSTSATRTSATATSTTTSSATVTSTTTASATVTSTITTLTIVTSTTTASSTVTSTTTASATVTSTTTTSTFTTVTNTTSTVTTATTSSTTTFSSTSTSSTSSSTTSSSTTLSSTTLSSTTVSSTTSSSTTLSITSTTTSTTLKNDFALPSTVREDSPEGAVVAAALESVLLATKSSEGSVTSSTPSGNVTVVKLSGSAANSSTPDQNRMVLQINNGNAGAAGTGNDGSLSTVAVSVPLAVVEDLAQGQNVLLSVMTIAEEVSLTLPNANTERETVELTSKVMELSLVLEAGGAVTVANVSDLTEPIAFQLTAGEAVPGDQCAFFDPVSQTWSTKGMGNMDAETFTALGLGSTMNGTWCLTTHTSMFALVQIIPFESMWDPEAGALNANGYIVAGAFVALVVCLMLCFACGLLGRRMRPAAAGQTEIQDTKGRRHVVTFSRSQVMAETKTVVSDEDDEHEETMDAKKKVHIRWDVDPGRFLKRLNHLKGHRWVSMDLRAKRVKGVTASVTKEASQSYAKRSFRNMLQGIEGEDGETNQTTNEAPQLGRQASVTSEAFLGAVESNQDSGVAREDSEIYEVSLRGAASDFGLVEVSVDPSPGTWEPSSAWQEMYQDAQLVHYYSRTHGKTLLGFVQGSGQFIGTDADELPRYNCSIGVRRQLRRMVPLTDLRPPFRGGDPVMVFLEDERTWHPGVIAATPALALHHAAKFQVSVLDMDPSGALLRGPRPGSGLLLTDVPFERIRRRFPKGHRIRAYRGRYNGCYNGQIVEEAIEAPAGFTRTAAEASDDPTRPDREASIQLSAVASMTSADTQNTGATGVAPETTLLQVKLDGAEEPVEIASYLVMSVIDKSSM